MTTTVRNPWTGQYIEIDPSNITENHLASMAQHMDDETREAIHSAMAPCSPGAFFAAYAGTVGPEAAGVIWFS